jgi:nucleoside-diphosphate-sugar epimerase
LRIFLTGGTGLVGSHVAEQLVARGYDVRALARAHSDTDHLERTGCDLVAGDMSDGVEELARAMADCDALVHAAALVGARATRERYRDANVAGTRSVLEAAARAGVRRAIHVSSVAVYGMLEGKVTEDRWQEVSIQSRAYYADSKRASEAEAWRFHEARGMLVTSVRPALIYGERDRHVTPRLARLLRLPVLPLPDGGRHVLPLVYAGNVARGIVSALERPASAGRSYNLAQDNRLPLREFVQQFARGTGRRAPRIAAVSARAIERVARTIDRLSRRIPGLDLPGLARPARLAGTDNPFDSDRARRELEWTELVPAEEAIRRTTAWMVTHSRGRSP